jgi:hypothetical protein
MSKGLKVGTNTATNTDNELVYSSEWNNWKIFAQNSKDLVVPADMNTYSTSITHGLGYVPAVEVWVVVDGLTYACPGYENTFNIPFDWLVDNDKVYFYAANYTFPEVQKTITFKYTVYYERIDA